MAGAPYLRILQERIRRPAFNALFLFVTSRCNSLCRTCFYFDKLNSRDDLSFDEIRRISETAPPFRKLWLSGGEPTLREELGEIIGLFARNNGVRNINLPTNGLLPEKLFRIIDEALQKTGEDVAIDLNFSLDGLANTHDAIRGVPNNFTRTLATIREAEARYGGVRRLRRNVVSVITRDNYTELVNLGLWIAENTNSNGHYFEVVRGATPDPCVKAMTREDVTQLHRRLFPLHRHYARRLFAHLSAPAKQVATAYYLGNLRMHFDVQERCYDGPSQWPMRCTAGQTTLVIDHNGRFRACELRGIIGNLHDHKLDVSAALASNGLKSETAAIERDGCWCTHSCFIHESSKFSARAQLLEIPWAWWKQNFEKIEAAPLEELERFRNLELA
jgi:MoaA/NifB/PqqE/SkfB family radical SAM enzyme